MDLVCLVATSNAVRAFVALNGLERRTICVVRPTCCYSAQQYRTVSTLLNHHNYLFSSGEA